MPTTQTASGAASRTGQAGWRLGLALAVIAAAQLMVVLDETIVNVALPRIQRLLGSPGSGQKWRSAGQRAGSSVSVMGIPSATIPVTTCPASLSQHGLAAISKEESVMETRMKSPAQVLAAIEPIQGLYTATCSGGAGQAAPALRGHVSVVPLRSRPATEGQPC
jgi:hypothetical protein